MAFAQYNPATPAPYNPIALGEVTGAPRTAVQAGQSNYQSLSQNRYLGGVHTGKLSASPVALSLDDAVAPGLKQNLAGVLATDAITDAQGQHWQALSQLLPYVITDTGFGVHQVNVKAAFDITVPGQPPIIGPFGYFDSRAYFTQSAFDWTSIEQARSSQAQLKSAEFFSTLVLIPEFLQTLMGYTAELAGLVLSGGGVVFAGDDAHRRPAFIKDSSAMADRDGMAVPRYWIVLLRAPD